MVDGAAACDGLAIKVIEEKVNAVFLIQTKHGRSQVSPSSLFH